VVLEEGTITGVGKHAELLATSPTYARFHKTNAEMYLAAGLPVSENRNENDADTEGKYVQ
jgi:hypothetical protein